VRRKALSVIANIEPRRFDTLMTRGQIPFHKPDEGWGQYSLDDAFRLRLMLDLVDNGGCEIASAIEAIEYGLRTNWLAEYPLTRDRAAVNTWLAVASISFADSGNFEISNYFAAGPYETIPQLVQGIGENIVRMTSATDLDVPAPFKGCENDPLYQAIVANVGVCPDYTPGRIIMVNASLAAQKVVQAAELLELELTDDDFPTLPDDDPNALEDFNEAIHGWNQYVERMKAARAVYDGGDS